MLAGMRRTPDECPRCGAPLPSAIAGVRVRSCSYCHTTVEDPERPPLQASRTPGASTNPSGLVGSLLVAGCVVLAAAFAAFRVVGRPPPPRSPVVLALAPPATAKTAPEATCERLRALSGLVLVPQNDDADALLLVVEPFTTPNEQRRLTARDPSNGHELWSRPIAFEGPAEQILRIPLADALVVALPNRLWGLDPASGQTAWEHETASTPEQSCARGRDFGLIDVALAFSAYSAVTGSPTSLARAACEPIYDSRSDGPNFAFVDAATAARWLPPGDRFAVTRGLLPRRGAAQVVLGMQASEAGAPASVGVVAGKRWLWQAHVANEAPGAASFTTPPLAAVREQRVVVPYIAQQHVALTGLELNTGERLWTTALPESNDGHSSAPVAQSGQNELVVARGGHAAYRAASGDLTVLNLDTGAIEWTLACRE